MNKKVIVVLGQTASGKSALAVKLARKFGGEIISADSRQVYRGLDIGTGKITRKEMRGIPHHLLDVANPKNKFSVSKYQKLAVSAIDDMTKKGKIPVICGGTGLYIDSITQGTSFPEVPPDTILRKKLGEKSAEELFSILKKVDSKRAKNIDPRNKVRLVRAIEIAKHLGRVPSLASEKLPYDFIKIGLALPAPELKKRIEKRVKKMFADGLLWEIAGLKKDGVSARRLAELGFEYNQPTYEKVVAGTIKYAKRQMTWFKRDQEIKWFRPEEEKKILRFVAGQMKNRRQKRK